MIQVPYLTLFFRKIVIEVKAEATPAGALDEHSCLDERVDLLARGHVPDYIALECRAHRPLA